LAESKAPQNSEPLELLKASSPFRDFRENLWAALGLGPKTRFAGDVTAATERLTEATRGRLPARGLLYSSLLHEAAIIALLLLPAKFRPERKFYEFERWLPLDTKLTYTLPELGGGQKGGGKPGGKSGGGSAKKGGESPAPAPKAGGLVYPAPQPVVSNPILPTNRIQTILQPDLVKPPQLKVPIPLPNMVKLARGIPAPPPLVPRVNMAALPPARPPEAPKLRAEVRPPNMPYSLPLPDAPPMENPKLPLPPATPEPPKEYHPIVPKVDLPQGETSVAAAPAPSLALPSGAGGTDERSILVLSPTPGPPEMAANLPVGEARGQFAMGPEPNLKGSSSLPPGLSDGVEGGTGTGPAGSTGTGIGGTGTGSGGSGSGSGEGGGGGGIGKGTGPGTGDGAGPGKGTGSGTGTGTGSGSGIDGTGGRGTGSGTGTGTGSGPGRGSGTGTGTGTGSGSGPGTNPFPGISIAGGTGTTGVVGGTRSSTIGQPGPRPTYGMTIVATAASGGGLRDYGIFRNELVSTVYIQMTHSPTPAPSWTLQYARLRRPSGNSNSVALGSGSVQMQDHVIAPFPMEKEKPQFPEEAVARNLGRMIVVYAEITHEGKVENTRIIQSPNPLLNQPLLAALAKWVFRPAESNGQPVAVKALMGIPLSLPR
jgi:TonB family protein